jgi:hypothetical protein
MKEGTGAEERLFRKSHKPSEDMSCNWHYKKSPGHNDFSPTDATGMRAPATWTRSGAKSATLSRATS